MLWFFGVVLVSMLYLFNIEHRKLEDAMAKWQTIDQLPAEYKAN